MLFIDTVMSFFRLGIALPRRYFQTRKSFPFTLEPALQKRWKTRQEWRYLTTSSGKGLHSLYKTLIYLYWYGILYNGLTFLFILFSVLCLISVLLLFLFTFSLLYVILRIEKFSREFVSF